LTSDGKNFDFGILVHGGASVDKIKETNEITVGMVTGIKNPIKLARQIMERTDHVMIVSDGATKLSKLFDSAIEDYPHELNEKKMKEYSRLLKNFRTKWKKNIKLMMLSSMACQEEKKSSTTLFYCRIGCN
jgi:beta-aspartyl-peptidase (threonine type)